MSFILFVSSTSFTTVQKPNHPDVPPLSMTEKMLVLELVLEYQSNEYLAQENRIIKVLGSNCYFGFVREKQDMLLELETKKMMTKEHFWNIADYDYYRIWDNEREADFWRELLDAARHRAKLMKKEEASKSCKE